MGARSSVRLADFVAMRRTSVSSVPRFASQRARTLLGMMKESWM